MSIWIISSEVLKSLETSVLGCSGWPCCLASTYPITNPTPPITFRHLESHSPAVDTTGAEEQRTEKSSVLGQALGEEKDPDCWQKLFVKLWRLCRALRTNTCSFFLLLFCFARCMENNYSFGLIQRRRWSYSAAALSLYKECGRKRPKTQSWPWGPMLRKLLQAPLDLGSLCLVDLMTPVVLGDTAC